MRILVVVDMQNDFIDGVLGTPEAQAIVDNVVAKITGFDGTVAFTQDTHSENYMNTQEGRALPVKHCVLDTHGWELNDKVAEALNSAASEAFIKHTFGSTHLGSWLALMESVKPLDEVVLVGLCTDICVISNALLVKAFLPEVKVTVYAACCAGVTPASHENALRAMQMCQVNIENWEG